MSTKGGRGGQKSLKSCLRRKSMTPKAFSQPVNLKKHIISVHNGQKDHKCVSCGKSFSQAGHLKRHINEVHNGQKDHKCDSCGKSFSQAGNLRTHINTAPKGH